MNIDHLNHGKFHEQLPWCHSGSQCPQTLAHRDMHAVGQKADKDVRFDPFHFLVINRSNREIAFQILEGLLYLG